MFASGFEIPRQNNGATCICAHNKDQEDDNFSSTKSYTGRTVAATGPARNTVNENPRYSDRSEYMSLAISKVDNDCDAPPKCIRPA